MAGRVAGKVVLITGAARGLGASSAELLASEGAKIVIADILDDEGAAVAAAITAAGGAATFVHLDVTMDDQWARAVATAEERYGRLDVLVNNAGVSQRTRTIEDTTREEWDRMLAIGLTGVFLGTKAALPALERAGGGSIINISSIAGLVGSRAIAYAAAKGGVRLMTKSTALLGAPRRIRCNSLHPGPTDTGFDGPLRNADTLPATLARIPLARLGRPIEIAYGVLYLASDESSFVTGSELVIDGGVTAV